LRELIERFPNPQRANSFLYQVSFKFLEHLGLTKVEDLPDYDKLHQKIRPHNLSQVVFGCFFF